MSNCVIEIAQDESLSWDPFQLTIFRVSRDILFRETELTTKKYSPNSPKKFQKIGIVHFKTTKFVKHMKIGALIPPHCEFVVI